MSSTPGADQLQALITLSNDTTGASDAKISDAIATLASGYDGGNGNATLNTYDSNQATPGADLFQALINYSNDVTGASDTTLSECVATLIAGYGQGDSITTSKCIIVANAAVADGYINNSGEVASLANNGFIDTFYNANPFAVVKDGAFIQNALRGAFYDSSKTFLSRGYTTSGYVYTSVPDGAGYMKVGWGNTSTPDYVFIAYPLDSSLFPNSGYIDSSGEIASGNYVTTDFLEVGTCDKYFLYSACRVAFYDSSQAFISRTIVTGSDVAYGDVPSSAVYYRITTSGTYYNPLCKSI